MKEIHLTFKLIVLYLNIHNNIKIKNILSFNFVNLLEKLFSFNLFNLYVSKHDIDYRE